MWNRSTQPEISTTTAKISKYMWNWREGTTVSSVKQYLLDQICEQKEKTCDNVAAEADLRDCS